MVWYAIVDCDVVQSFFCPAARAKHKSGACLTWEVPTSSDPLTRCLRAPASRKADLSGKEPFQFGQLRDSGSNLGCRCRCLVAGRQASAAVSCSRKWSEGSEGECNRCRPLCHRTWSILLHSTTMMTMLKTREQNNAELWTLSPTPGALHQER